MKTKLVTLLFIGLSAGSLAGFAQDKPADDKVQKPNNQPADAAKAAAAPAEAATPAEPLVTKIYQLKYTSPSNLVTIVTPTISGRSKVIPDSRTSQLIVLATEKELLELDPLIEKLDTATKQVLIEARILETEKTPETAKGINWERTFGNQNFSFGNNLDGGQAGRYSKDISVTTNIAGGFFQTTTYGPNNLVNQ